MDKSEAEILLYKYNRGKATAKEIAILESWYLENARQLPGYEAEFDYEAKRLKILSKIYRDRQPVNKTRRLWPRVAAAAVVLIAVAAGMTLYLGKIKENTGIKSAYINDIAPGKVGATLTLASGKKIRLADAANGEIAKEAGITVTKAADGQLVYQMGEGVEEGDKMNTVINTLSTANGETYVLILPDRSKVWLNAASSLSYTASLIERGRRVVRLSGEAYFEVYKDKAHPFVVETDGQQVEVLGTHFNINAYKDETAVRTTLLEGSVNVSSSTQSQILKPGEQSILINNSIAVQKVNAEDAIAWKNGLFVFEDESLQSIMRKVERWYDVEVVYQGVDRDKLYWGGVSRYDHVSKVLAALELTKNIHFKIEGRRIIVTK